MVLKMPMSACARSSCSPPCVRMRSCCAVSAQVQPTHVTVLPEASSYAFIMRPKMSLVASSSPDQPAQTMFLPPSAAGSDALESSAVLSAASSFAASAGVVSVAVSFGVEAQATRLRHSTTARSNARSFFMVSFSFLFRQHHTIRQADLARIFSSDQGFGKCRNTVCISNFSNRRAGEKGPSKRAGAIVRCCPYLS